MTSKPLPLHRTRYQPSTTSSKAIPLHGSCSSKTTPRSISPIHHSRNCETDSSQANRCRRSKSNAVDFCRMVQIDLNTRVANPEKQVFRYRTIELLQFEGIRSRYPVNCYTYMALTAEVRNFMHARTQM